MRTVLDDFERWCRQQVGWLVRVARTRGIAVRIEPFDELRMPAGTRGYFVRRASENATSPYGGLIMVNAQASDNGLIEEFRALTGETEQAAVSSAARWFDILFTILHELGHASLHAGMDMLVYASDPDYHDAREAEADWFAGAYLGELQKRPDLSPADGCRLCDDLRQFHQGRG